MSEQDQGILIFLGIAAFACMLAFSWGRLLYWFRPKDQKYMNYDFWRGYRYQWKELQEQEEQKEKRNEFGDGLAQARADWANRK